MAVHHIDATNLPHRLSWSCVSIRRQRDRHCTQRSGRFLFYSLPVKNDSSALFSHLICANLFLISINMWLLCSQNQISESVSSCLFCIIGAGGKDQKSSGTHWGSIGTSKARVHPENISHPHMELCRRLPGEAGS